MTAYSTSLRMPEKLKNDIAEIAAYHDRKPHWVMIKAIERFAAQEKAEIEFLRERARLANIEREENGALMSADDAIEELEEFLQGLK